MVFSPSLPPAICTTINVRFCAACAQVAPSSAALCEARTARAKIGGIIMPALTASRPSLIMALRESIMAIPRFSVQVILGHGHQEIEHLAHAHRRNRRPASKGERWPFAGLVDGVVERAAPVAGNVVVEHRRDIVISQVFGAANSTLVDGLLHWRVGC